MIDTMAARRHLLRLADALTACMDERRDHAGDPAYLAYVRGREIEIQFAMQRARAEIAAGDRAAREAAARAAADLAAKARALAESASSRQVSMLGIAVAQQRLRHARALAELAEQQASAAPSARALRPAAPSLPARGGSPRLLERFDR